MPVEELLDFQRQRVLLDLRDQPELQVRLASNLGLIYQHQGFFPQAQELLEHSLQRAAEVYGAQHPRTARIQLLLGGVLANTSDLGTSGDHLTSTIAVFEQHLPETRGDLATALTTYG